MCGIIGLLAKNQSGFFSKDADIFSQLLYADAVRGWDATGVFGVLRNGDVDIKKQAAAAGHFLQTPQYESFSKKLVSDYRIAIGHNRKATHGEKRHADAHPFWDAEEKICLVHNGMIRNYKDFCKEATVDSAAIANALATRPRKEVLEEVDGAFVFIWYDVEEKSLYIIKNSDRPLAILETSSTFIICSEMSLGFWITNRNNEKVANTIVIEDMVLYQYTLEERLIVEVEKIEKKSRPISIITANKGGSVTVVSQNHSTNGASATNDISAFADHDTMFLVNTDLKTPEDASKYLKLGCVVGVNIQSYEEKKDYVKLDCTLINVDRKWMAIHTYVSVKLFNELDLTAPHKLEISSVRKHLDTVVIYGIKLTPTDSFTTLNDVIITEDMWFSDIMPCECTICNERIFWGEMPKSSILMSDLCIDVVVCPQCSSSSKEANV